MRGCLDHIRVTLHISARDQRRARRQLLARGIDRRLSDADGHLRVPQFFVRYRARCQQRFTALIVILRTCELSDTQRQIGIRLPV